MTSISALHALALEQLRSDDFSLAAKTIRRMLILLPPAHESRASLLITLAFAHFEAGDVEEAHRVATHATKLDPKNALAWQQVQRAERARKAS
jgi:Flp pilus assembly protein TadD